MIDSIVICYDECLCELAYIFVISPALTTTIIISSLCQHRKKNSQSNQNFDHDTCTNLPKELVNSVCQ